MASGKTQHSPSEFSAHEHPPANTTAATSMVTSSSLSCTPGQSNKENIPSSSSNKDNKSPLLSPSIPLGRLASVKD